MKSSEKATTRTTGEKKIIIVTVSVCLCYYLGKFAVWREGRRKQPNCAEQSTLYIFEGSVICCLLIICILSIIFDTVTTELGIG